MSKLTDKVSYLKGLAAGMKLNMEKDSNKLLLEILGAMGDMAEEMQRMDEAHRELQDYVESIDDDLSDLTETLFSDEEEDDEDDDEYFEVECPVCGEEFYVDAETVMEGEAVCPECGTEIEVEVEGEVDDEDEDDEECECGGDCGCKNH